MGSGDLATARNGTARLPSRCRDGCRLRKKRKRESDDTTRASVMYKRPHKLRVRLSIRLRDRFDPHEVNCPAAFSFQGLGDLPRIADEVVTGERKLEPKSSFLRVQSPAQHEPSHITPIRFTIAREHALLPNGFKQHSR